MTMPILTTKLHIPPARTNAVARPHLIEKLETGLSGKLTLVSAPAGFGKTTLIGEWVNARTFPTAWLSLDEVDHDPVRFVTYVVAALQTILPHVGNQIGNLLQSAHPPPIQSLVTALINDLTTITDDFVLVLDDYHIVDSPMIDHAIMFLIEHMPHQMHLVISTREDPPLPLARLRARGQLIELRATDLRFSFNEAATFLNQIMNLNLSADDIVKLETRTEGWIAGLQLAALSMQGQTDIAKFLESFAGTHHFVLDYLVEEVLLQQPDRIQTFLLYTSMLDRLCGPLCDAVLQDDTFVGQEILESLRQANLFLVPLDNERRWYRYHHLFADLLRQRLHQKVEGSAVDELHRRASQWYEENDFDIEAFQHAAAANDVDRAARLVQGEGMPLHYRGAITPVLDWLESLPATTSNANPALLVTYASALTMLGRPVNAIEEKLQVAEFALRDAESTDKNRDLIGQIAAIRAMLAVPQNQIDSMVTQSRRALTNLHPDNLSVRTNAAWTLGLAYQIQGDREAAHQAYSEALSISEASGNTMIAIAAATGLGQVQEAQNQLYQATEFYERVLQLVGNPPLPYACEAILGLGRIYYEWNDLDAAEEYAQQSLELAQQLENVDTPVACAGLLIRLKLARGEVAEANDIWAEAERFVHENHFEHRLPDLTAAQIPILLHQDNLMAAEHLAHDLPLSQARVHLAQEDPSAALAILEPLRQEAETRDWADERLKVMILQALAYHTAGETDRAVHVLGDAMQFAKPGGFIRLFMDEGLPLAQLLTEVSTYGLMPNYTDKLLAAFEAESYRESDQSSAQSGLIETLTSREQEVLSLIVEGYSNPEIAEELVIAVTTVKTHVKNIYGKLDVENRYQAINRAKNLNLF